MSADNRTVTTDALHTLGTILTGPEKRDAIHLAVEPVIAAHDLEPGDHITVVNGKAAAAARGKGLGIVDPYLTATVKTGERFWFIMYPRTITSLRHVWSHPAFSEEEAKPDGGDEISRAKARIAEIAMALGPEGWDEDNGRTGCLTYERLMAGAHDHLKHDDWITQHGGESWRDDFYQYAAEFWRLYAIVTGEEVPEGYRDSFFSCSC